MKKLKLNLHVLEIAYCLEHQFYPDTRVTLLAMGVGAYKAYIGWLEDLIEQSIKICKKEKLI